MAGILGLGSLTSPRRSTDPRDHHVVTGDEIMARARSRLPDPPDDQEWQRRGQDWVLVARPRPADAADAGSGAAGAAPDPAPPPNPTREHVVLPGETLQGLCLRYKTTARALAKANPSLDARDSLLRGVSVVLIPGDGPSQPDSPEVRVARVRAACPRLSAAEARFYLSDAGSVADAVARARDDDAWEAEQRDAGRAARKKKADASPSPSPPVVAVAHEVPEARAVPDVGADVVDAVAQIGPTAVGDAVVLVAAPVESPQLL